MNNSEIEAYFDLKDFTALTNSTDELSKKYWEKVLETRKYLEKYIPTLLKISNAVPEDCISNIDYSRVSEGVIIYYSVNNNSRQQILLTDLIKAHYE